MASSKLRLLLCGNCGRHASSNEDQEVPAKPTGAPPASADVGAKAPLPETASAEQQTPAPSASQRVWNMAYDSLEEDEGTAKLVKNYMKILDEFPEPENDNENDNGTSAPAGGDVSTKLKNPITREERMRQVVEAGQAKISTKTKFMDAVGSVSKYFNNVKTLIDSAVGSIPQAALPWAGVCIGLQILVNPANATNSNIAGINYVVSRMEWYCCLTEHILKTDNLDVGSRSFKPILEKLENKVLELYKALLLYQMKSVCSYYRNQGAEFLRGLLVVDDWDSELQTVKEAEAALEKDSQEFNRRHATSILGDVRKGLWEYIAQQKDDKDTECLRHLRVVDPQDDMHNIEKHKEKSLKEVYEWILRTEEYSSFTNWTDEGSCPLLWVKGPAGTGKTMLLVGIIRELSDRPYKFTPSLSYFFCQASKNEVNHATAILRSLIWLLLVQQPHLVKHLQKKYKNSGETLFKDGRTFTALSGVFTDMLHDSELSHAYLIVDALDECEALDESDRETSGIKSLIELISQSIKISDNKVKWLVSSRPEVGLDAELKDLDSSVTPLELDVQSQEHTVKAYIDHKLSLLKRRKGYNNEDILLKLSYEIHQRANNIFLWVALVFEELASTRSWEAIDLVRGKPRGLFPLYDIMMAKVEDRLNQRPQYCKNVLMAACLAYRPLSFSELAVLAGLPSKVPPEDIVEDCGSFLITKEDKVDLLHQSVRDYLKTKYKSWLQKGEVAQEHTDVSKRSIDAMSEILAFNIYRLHPGSLSKDIKPPDPDPLAPIRYSCEFWVDHLCEADGQSSELENQLRDDGIIFGFLKEHLLEWLESLSLLRKLPNGVSAIRKLSHKVQLTSNKSSQFSRFLKDAEKFILKYWSTIERAPLQAYGSALAFSPTTSEVKSLYWEKRSSSIRKIKGVTYDWDPCLQILEGHDDEVTALAFSPDGKVLATGSRNGIVMLWDAVSGTCKQVLEGHDGAVATIVFSPNSKVLASGSEQYTVRLWSTATGTRKLSLDDHYGTKGTVIFSPDGKTFASISFSDDIVQLWDADTGTWKQTLAAHDHQVDAIVFSPDSKVLLSVSNEDIVQLWDVATETWKPTLEGHDGGIVTIAFSSDGKILASVESHGDAVQLWDAATEVWKQKQNPAGDDGYVSTIAFSSDGKIASGSFEAVQLWDDATETWKQNQAPKGYNDTFTTIDFSPDSKVFASFSDTSESVLLCEAATGIWKQTLKGHSKSITSIAFSPDGKVLASGSDDCTVRLWDTAAATETCEQKQTLKSHDGEVTNLAFSHDGEVVASSSGDDTKVLLWDAVTGICKRTFEHEFGITALAFSPDDKVLASQDYRITKLWDIATGDCKQTFKDSKQNVCMVFSSDGKVLASGAIDNLRLWDVTTGTCIHTLIKGYKHQVNTVAFSPDDKFLASGSWDRTVRLWDTTTGACKTLRGHNDAICSVAFSSDGKVVASGSMDDTVKLWDFVTEDLNQTFRANIFGTDLLFSEDGQYLKTNLGWVSLDSNSSDASLRQKLSTGVIYVDEEGWVGRNGQKLLLLPPDYRAVWHAVYNNILVIGNVSGQVVFLEFS